jgi:hypothetical protein
LHQLAFWCIGLHWRKNCGGDLTVFWTLAGAGRARRNRSLQHSDADTDEAKKGGDKETNKTNQFDSSARRELVR